MSQPSRPSGNCGSSRRVGGRWSIVERGAVAGDAGEFFSLLDEKLGLGTEGYSAALLGKIEYAGADASSFDKAASSLRRLPGRPAPRRILLDAGWARPQNGRVKGGTGRLSACALWNTGRQAARATRIHQSMADRALGERA